jgi:hypothetical protein
MGSPRPLALALALSACATAPLEPERPPGPPPFRGIGRVLLVRADDRRGGSGHRPKDALDAVRESLAGGGRATREVDVGSRLGRELAGVAALYRRVEGRAFAGGAAGWAGQAVERVDAPVSLFEELQVDAAVLYYRFEPRGLPPPPPLPGGMPDLPHPTAAPLAALALVDRAGNLAWFEWGALEDRPPGAMDTAAEAVDALLRVIAGPEAADGPDA